jgi:hypothetical protein
VFKTEYSPSLRHIRIRAEYTRLVRHLQTLLGREFLQDHRLVVANPSRNSLFLETYCFNHVSTDKSIVQRSGKGQRALFPFEVKGHESRLVYNSKF